MRPSTLLFSLAAAASSLPAAEPRLVAEFAADIRPTLASYCVRRQHGDAAGIGVMVEQFDPKPLD